ncbi:MAG: glycoside hydrolase family 88 protein [Paludibacter sp.]
MKLKFKHIILFIAVIPIATQAKDRETATPQWIKTALDRSSEQLLAAADKCKKSKLSPRTYENGAISLVGTNDWTCGFFPGSLWYMYEITKNDTFKTEAERFTGFIEKAQYRKDTHDLGFILNSSYGNGYRLTNNEQYKSVLVTGSKSLMTRYHPEFGLIKSWDNRNGWQFPVIIDNMLNLEFLCNVGIITGDSSLKIACKSHADKTMVNQFRPDNSCYHVVNYDSISGKVICKETHQGFSNSSSWARGQGWALYGYTMMYRETKEAKYLEQAQKVAAFILNNPNLPVDKVPYWDFNAPNIPNAPRDASAAAVYASALIELSTFVKEKNNYLETAETILKNLSSEEYLSKKGENGLFILKHSTGNWPKKSEVNAPLSYADYYYLEALGRYMKVKGMKWKNVGM